jgi:hypothetical protein
MDIGTECLSHLLAAHIGNGMQCEAIIQLQVILQIFSYAVDDQMQKLMLLMKEESNRKVSNLLL